MWDDLRFAWRRLWHSPGFALMAILTLGVAVGANTAVLSIADGVLFRPLPYEQPDRVFLIQQANRVTGRRSTLIRVEEIATIERGRGLSKVGLYDRGTSYREDTPDGVVAIPTIEVNPAYFRVLGLRPAAGRLFADADQADAGRVAMLSHASWRQRFGGDPAVVGTTVAIGGGSFDVVGVLPASFYFPTYAAFSGEPEIVTVMARPEPGGAGGFFHPVVRLMPGVTREQAQAELDSLFPPVDGEPAEGGSRPFLDEIRPSINLAGVPITRFLVAAAMLVFLLGCANLANMLLVRGRRNQRDIAVRAALGASATRLVRPVLLEAVLIGLAGSFVALGVTAMTFDALLDQVPPGAYGNIQVGVDGRVLLIGLALGVVGSLAFAAGPAWRTSRLDVLGLLQRRSPRGATGARRAGSPLVGAQVAIAVTLVFGAVIAARAFTAVMGTPLGFEPDGVVVVSVYPSSQPRTVESFYPRAVELLREQPGVEAAGASGYMALGAAPDESIRSPDGERSAAAISHVLPGFFESARIPLVRGRLLTWDDLGSDAAVISESAAALLFPNENPLGRVLDNGAGRLSRFVGIVGDVRWGPTAESRPTVFVIPGAATRVLALTARVSDSSDAVVARLRRAVGGMVPGETLSATRWRDRLDRSFAVANPRFQALVLSSFAAIALGLTALGIFGVVAYLVVTRSKEMGIRMAIGAAPQSLVRLMVVQALVPVVLGLIAGLVATRWLAGFAEAQLYDVSTDDPATLVASALTVVVAAALAAWIPARRASRVDPVAVLKAE